MSKKTDPVEPDLDDLIDEAQAGWHDVPIMLDGSRRDEWNQAVKAAMQPDRDVPDGSFAAKSPAAVAQKRVDALKAELRLKILTVRIFQMPGTEWAALKAKHGPRKNNKLDEQHGYNREAVARLALVSYGKRARNVGTDAERVEDISSSQWTRILGKAGGGDLEALEWAVIGVNQLVGQAFVGALVKGSPATSSSAGK